MRKNRYIPPQSLIELCCRTFQNRRLLRPSPEIRDLILGIVGRAQRRTGITIHALVFLSTHYHMLVTARDALQLAQFMAYVNSNVAREVGRLTGWRDKFWGRRYEATPVSSEEAAQIARLRYVISNGVKEGLVARPEDWPGVHCAAALQSECVLEGTWYDRTRAYEAGRSRRNAPHDEFLEKETVELTPLPCWSQLSSEAQRARILDLVDSIVEEGEAHRASTGRAILGAAAVMQADPASRSAFVERSPAPWIHAATQAARDEFRRAWRIFSEAFRAAAERLKAGDRQANFPPGSFPPALPWVPHDAWG